MQSFWKEECGVEATLINPRYITGLDVEMLEELKRSHSLVVTLEDGELDGGFGEKIARFLWKFGCEGLELRST